MPNAPRAGSGREHRLRMLDGENEQRVDHFDHTEWKALPTGAATTTRNRQQMDRDLVEAAAKGDRAAYVDLIGSRADGLFAIAQRILRDVDRAEDALQDALVIAWRDLRGLRDADRFDA